MLNIDQLNSKFAIEGQLHFIAGKGGFPLIVIDNEIATAQVNLNKKQPRGRKARRAGTQPQLVTGYEIAG